jgi:endonuclease III
MSNLAANHQRQSGGGTRETKKGTLSHYFSFLPKSKGPQAASYCCKSKEIATRNRGGIHCRQDDSNEEQAYDNVDNPEDCTGGRNNTEPIEILSSDDEEEEELKSATKPSTKSYISEALHGDDITSTCAEKSVSLASITNKSDLFIIQQIIKKDEEEERQRQEQERRNIAEQQPDHGKSNGQGNDTKVYHNKAFDKHHGVKNLIEIHDHDETHNEERVLEASKQMTVNEMKVGADADIPPLHQDEQKLSNMITIGDVEEDSTSTPSTSNLFAAFAFGGGTDAALDVSSLMGTSFTALDYKAKSKLNTKETFKTKTATTLSNLPQPTSNKKRKSCKSAQREEECPWEERPEEYKRQCITKWHSFADDTASIEIRRFQILVAARLHAQAHESVVRDAMASLPQKLKHHSLSLETHAKKKSTEEEIDASTQSEIVYNGDATEAKCKSSALNVHTMSQLDPVMFASWIPSVHFGTSKAKQIIQASHDLIYKFHGQVPESTRELQQLTGIGPALAAILSRVNTRASFTSLALDSVEKTPRNIEE